MVEVLSRFALRALSARCVSRVDGSPMRVLSMGETVRLLRGVVELAVESVVVVVVVLDGGVDMLDESVPVVVVLAFGGVVVVAELSVCWLCVGVGAGAPMPSCVVSVVGVVDGDVVIDDESVVVDDDGVVVVDDGDVVTSPVDVACEPSFDTRM